MERLKNYFDDSLISTPREKAARLGMDSLLDEELLALLLDTGYKNCNVVQLSKKFLEEKGGLKGVFLLSSFLKYPGIGKAKSYRLLAVREIMRRLPFSIAPKIVDANTAFMLVKNSFAFLQEEKAIVLYLSQDKNLLFKDEYSVSHRSKVMLPIRKILETSIKENAFYVLVSHNHPSGLLVPSKEDVCLVNNLKNQLNLIQVELLDSLIIYQNEYVSFRKLSLI